MTIKSTGDVGIGTATPLARLHVWRSSSGATPNVNLDEFVIEAGANMGMSMLCPRTSLARFGFGDQDDNYVGGFTYNHADDSFIFLAGDIEILRLVGGNVKLAADNRKLFFGAGDDASIYYDGTNMVINPKK
jgi:hypothetical protein